MPNYLSSLTLILGFVVAVDNGSRLSLFHLSAVATFWPMSLVGIYHGRASVNSGDSIYQNLRELSSIILRDNEHDIAWLWEQLYLDCIC